METIRGGPTSQRPARSGRGRTCLNCRRRKIKCDGARPMCTQCSQSNGTFSDCEYPDGGPTQTQLLEERISQLTMRIREAENSSDYPSPYSLTLHQPYRSNSQEMTDDHAIHGPQPMSGSPAMSRQQSPSSSNVPPHLSHAASPSHPLEPSVDARQAIFNIFRPHLHRFGFFLNPDWFLWSLSKPLPLGHSERPLPSLMNVVYLWASHLSNRTNPSPNHNDNESIYLRNALQHLPTDLSYSSGSSGHLVSSGDHTNSLIQYIQAEILLSYYYLQNGRLTEGNYHSNSALSLAFAAGFYRWSRDESRGGAQAGPSTSEGVDDVQRDNMRDAFCAAVILNNCWIALQESHAMSYDVLSLSVGESSRRRSWEMERVGSQLSSSHEDILFKTFLDNENFTSQSFMALRAKATLLLERATMSWNEKDPRKKVHLDHLIENFKTYLSGLLRTIVNNQGTASPETVSPSATVQSNRITPFTKENLITTMIVAHLATLRLHCPTHAETEQSVAKCIGASVAVANLTPHLVDCVRDDRQVDPIVGVAWASVCDGLMYTLTYGPHMSSRNSQILSSFDTVFSCMKMFSQYSTLIGYLVIHIERKYPSRPSH